MITRRSPEEIQSLVEGYRKREVTRAEYCRQQGISPTTLDYYLRRYGTKPARFARVKISGQPAEPAAAFALVLRNGRRIESAWNFRDADLGRLIRVAEAK
jgi:transposase-like protein